MAQQGSEEGQTSEVEPAVAEIEDIDTLRQVLAEEMLTFLAQRLLLPSLSVKPKKEHLDAPAVIEAMKKDKKRTGEGLVLIMLKDGYETVRVDDLGLSEVAYALGELGQLLQTEERA